MKHEWRKHEKETYLPTNKPGIVEITAFKYFTIEGEGNPNSDAFPEYIQVLYSLSYGVKMSYKKGTEPAGYFEYAVYPLEGVWDLKDESKGSYDGTLNKDDLEFKLMIRQPGFVDEQFAGQILDSVKEKKPHALLENVKFETLSEGTCIQMLHLGSYDNEPGSFRMMEEFATENGLKRHSKIHKEIYLTDARKVAPEKLKTVLRFQVENM